MKNLSNITIAQFRKVLTKIGAHYIRTSGGHEVWSKVGLTRPIILQTHKDHIPEFVIKNNLRTLNLSKDDFLDLLD